MAYDEKLADRIRDALSETGGVTEKRMFGGLSFLVHGNMCVGVVGDELCARVGPEGFEKALGRPHAREMDFTGRPMKGWLFVASDGVKTRAQVAAWVKRCLAFAGSLPKK